MVVNIAGPFFPILPVFFDRACSVVAFHTFFKLIFQELFIVCHEIQKRFCLILVNFFFLFFFAVFPIIGRFVVFWKFPVLAVFLLILLILTVLLLILTVFLLILTVFLLILTVFLLILTVFLLVLLVLAVLLLILLILTVFLLILLILIAKLLQRFFQMVFSFFVFFPFLGFFCFVQFFAGFFGLFFQLLLI